MFTREAVAPLTLLSARILGGLTVRSKKKNLEEKLIAICPGDPELARVQSMRDLGRVHLQRLEKFLEEYKTGAGRKHVLRAYGKAHAEAIIRRSAKAYGTRDRARD